jgi:hypothetical protein
MKSSTYDYVHPVEGNLMKSWSLGLQKKERAKLNSKIDALSMHGADLIPGILAPTGTPNIFKLKAQGQVKLRPMVCEGPGVGEAAFTFLLGAKEISWDYDPRDAPNLAADIRNDLREHPERRVEHERVN